MEANKIMGELKKADLKPCQTISIQRKIKAILKQKEMNECNLKHLVQILLLLLESGKTKVLK